MDKKEDENKELNDSNFQEEGEYIINKKPKYKYEIKIIHDNKHEKAKRKARTPDRIISLSKFSIINKAKNSPIKQNLNNKYNNNNNNNIFNNYNNDSHYDNFNNCSNYNFYDSKSSRNNKVTNYYSKESVPQTVNQINYMSKTSDNFYNRRNYKNIKYELINEENINENKKCICQKEFNRIIQNYFVRGKIIKNRNINMIKNRRKPNNINKGYYIKENYNNNSGRKRYFKNGLKIQKSIEKSYLPNEDENNLTYDIKKSTTNINNYDNNIHTKSSNSRKRNMNDSYVNISNNNIYTKYITKNINSNNYLYIKNKNKIVPEKKQVNYSIISIDDSRNKSINSYDKYDTNNVSKKDTNKIKSQNKNNKNTNNTSLSKYNKNNQLMIYKSSERREKIKAIPPGQKIEPLIVKKTVQKPTIEKVEKEDGSIANVMKQKIVVTTIENKPINKLHYNNKNENLVKECITNIYTTLTKNIDENENKTITKNKSFDNIQAIKKNDKNGIFIKRKIMDKKTKKNNLQQNQNIDINQKNIFDDKNSNNNAKTNMNIDISEISNDLLKNKTNNNSINYSSIFSYEQIEPNNNVIRINEEIKFIKYLYYRCTNLNSINNAKAQSLSNYFLKLSDEEKIAILTNLNDGDPENKKIYNKLINILKEKRLNNENENSINKNSNNFEEKFISDYDDEEDKKNKNLQTNILFKKKKVVK